jgi:hydroxyacylglutathione hydrolase
MIRDYNHQDPNDALITTLGQEKEFNTFFRLQNSSVIEKLVQDFPELGDSPDARAVFLKLRDLRNSW